MAGDFAALLPKSLNPLTLRLQLDTVKHIGVTCYEISHDFAENQTLQKRVPHA